MNRRNFIGLTSVGLIHLSSAPIAQAFGRKESDFLIRTAKERGQTDLGWLKSYHSFTFGNYFNEEAMSFRCLQVINDDKVAAGAGFPTHPHRDMEIISYVIKGELQHRDSIGNGSIITPDEVQYMAAGTGIEHSEFNPSKTKKNHFLQIWMDPIKNGLKPRYDEKKIEQEAIKAGLTLIASPNGANQSVRINQDAKMFAARPQPGKRVEYTVEHGRHAWLQVATGKLTVNGTRLRTGDAIATSRATRLVMEKSKNAEVLLFDLP